MVIVGKESKDAVEDTAAAAPAPVVAKQDRKAVRQVRLVPLRAWRSGWYLRRYLALFAT